MNGNTRHRSPALLPAADVMSRFRRPGLERTAEFIDNMKLVAGRCLRTGRPADQQGGDLSRMIRYCSGTCAVGGSTTGKNAIKPGGRQGSILNAFGALSLSYVSQLTDRTDSMHLPVSAIGMMEFFSNSSLKISVRKQKYVHARRSATILPQRSPPGKYVEKATCTILSESN